MNEQAEALDPNTPPARLLALLGKHPEKVLKNPAFELTLVAEPDVWAGLSWTVQHEVVRTPSCSLQLVAWVLRQEEPALWVLLRISQNEVLPVTLRREAFLRLPRFADFFFESVEPRVTTTLPLADFLSTDELSLFRRGGVDGQVDPSMTGAEVAQLASLGWTGRQLASRHPSCPPTALVEMLRLRFDHELWCSVFVHPQLPAATLAGFLVSPNELERRTAAENPAMSDTQFRAAAEDPKMRWAVARNPAVVPETQLLLAGDTSKGVREALLGNPKVTPEARRIAEELNAKDS